MPMIVGILTFISRIDIHHLSVLGMIFFNFSVFYFSIRSWNFHAQLSWAWKKFNNLGACPQFLTTYWNCITISWAHRIGFLQLNLQKYIIQPVYLLSNVCFGYRCPMKTHHSTDAHSCGLSKAVPNCVIYNYYLGQMQYFRTKISITVTLLTHQVTSASKLR